MPKPSTLDGYSDQHTLDCEPAVPAHAGSMDVDIAIDLQILADTQACQTLEENFKKRGFERAVNDKQQKGRKDALRKCATASIPRDRSVRRCHAKRAEPSPR